MATHPLTQRFPVGTTHRIIVSTVRENPCDTDGSSPDRLQRYWHEVIAQQPDHEPEKESVVVVMLTTRLRTFAWHRVSLGTVSESSAHPREIFRPVIASGAYAFAMMHNHPSGDPSPSRADEQVTRRIVEASKILQLPIMDHVIIGAPSPGRCSYYSFREAGLIP